MSEISVEVQLRLRDIREKVRTRGYGLLDAAGSDVAFLMFEYDRLAARLEIAEALLQDAAAHGELEQYRLGWKEGVMAAAIRVENIGRMEGVGRFVRELECPV